MRVLRRFVATSLLVHLLLPVSPVRATTLRALELPELVRFSPVVAVVRVASVDTVRTGGRNYTRPVLEVLDGLKGAAAGERLRAWIPGGEADGVIQFVSGVPKPEVGATWLVFLSREIGGEWQFTGLEQGAWAVAAGEAGWVVTPFVTAPRVGAVKPPVPMPYADVVSRVRAMVTP